MAFDGWKEKLFQRYLLWQCRPARIKGYLQSKLPARREAPPPDRKKIRAAALQVKLQLYKNPLTFVDEMHRRLKEAADQGALLVAFPEYNNLSLLGLLPGIEKMEEAYTEESLKDKSSSNQQDQDISLTEVFVYMSPAVQPLLDTVFSMLAYHYNLYIMAGSYTLSSGNEVVNRAFLYGSDGRLIGIQDKVHLLPIESEWQLKRGASFSLYETAVGRLALPVCMDATYYETFRILEKKGAEVILLPIANMESYNYWLALRGIWPRVQESPIYGVKSALVGSIAGMTFTGRAGIFAPLELTPQRDGVVAEVETFSEEGFAVADLDLEALQQLRHNHPWRDSNLSLYKRYFPTLY